MDEEKLTCDPLDAGVSRLVQVVVEAAASLTQFIMWQCRRRVAAEANINIITQGKTFKKTLNVLRCQVIKKCLNLLCACEPKGARYAH